MVGAVPSGQISGSRTRSVREPIPDVTSRADLPPSSRSLVRQ
jgi:hypothetical protein